jgi:hypothetical protein
MPNFFDKKEEVINIELTQYGKHLLSKGKFRPEYYAFYDDDVLYDTQYAGYAENQNETQPRILDHTPTMKPQSYRAGIEENIEELIESPAFTGLIEFNKFIPSYDPSAPLQLNKPSSKVKDLYASSTPMGTSEYNSEYAPSWDIKFLEGEIKSTTTHLTGTYESSKVPQLNIKTPEYKIKLQVGDVPEAEVCDIYNPSDTEEVVGTDLNIANDMNITSKKFSDGTFMTIEQDNLVLQIDEINSLYSNENFDIEVFLIEDASTTQGTEERLKTLNFIKKPSMVVNDILVDMEEQEEIEPTIDNVEYYLEISVDKDQSDKFWKGKGAAPRKSDVFYNEEDFEPDESKGSNIAVQGLYAGNNDGPFGEDC